jgi:hypothetical protein
MSNTKRVLVGLGSVGLGIVGFCLFEDRSLDCQILFGAISLLAIPAAIAAQS